MESSNTVKRKKRKTRKCLDEIRKRSHRTGQILFEKDSGKVNGHFPNYNAVNGNCLVTSSRLTLRMFPKAVRSETITRPALADFKEKPQLNLDEMAKGPRVISMLSSTKIRSPKIIDTFDNSIKHKNENFKLISHKSVFEDSMNYEECDVKNITNNQEEKLSSNFDLFTSADSAEVTDKSSDTDSIGSRSVSTLTISSNQSLHDDFGYNLYEEFMSEIPTYLKQNTTFVEEDVMKKTKVLLQNLFKESCYQECKDNMLECRKGNTANNINIHNEMIYNPMDYIRLGHVQQQSLFQQSSKIGGPNIIGGGTPHSPALASSFPQASPDSQSNVIVNDTPDYTYYPHRLN